MRRPDLDPPADGPGAVLHRHDDEDDQDEDGGRSVVFVAVQRSIERGADATGTDDPDHRGLAKVDVEPVEGEPHQPRHDLGLHRVIDHLQPACPTGPHCLNRAWVHGLDVLGEKFAEEADGGETQGQESCQRSEAYHRDKQNRDDDLLKTARDRKEGSTQRVYRHRRDIARRPEAERYREQHPEHCGSHRHGQALDHAAADVLGPADEVRMEETGQKPPRSAQALIGPGPVDLHGGTGRRQVEEDARG